MSDAPIWAVATVRLGKMLQPSPLASSDVEVAYLKSGHLAEWTDLVELPRMWASAADLRRYGVRSGDLMVAEGGDLGASRFVRSSFEPAIFQNSLHRVRITREGDIRFLRYALEALRATGVIDAMSDKATFGHYTLGKLKRTRVPWPEAKHQALVAGFLDRECGRIHDLSLSLSAQADALDEYRSAMVRDAVRKLHAGPLKHGFSVVDCKHRTPNYVSSGFPVISTREVKAGLLDLSGVERFVHGEDFRDMRDGGRDPRVGDIIYSRNASVGVAAYVSEPVDVCMGQDVVLITRRPRDCELLTHVLNFTIADQVERLSQGSTFSRINVPVIRSLVVPYDSPEAEADVVERIRAVFRGLARVEGEMRAMARQLAEYRQALIAEAVTGKLDVTRLSDRQVEESALAAMEGAEPEVLSA